MTDRAQRIERLTRAEPNRFPRRKPKSMPEPEATACSAAALEETAFFGLGGGGLCGVYGGLGVCVCACVRACVCKRACGCVRMSVRERA